jgi:hypothetical protein
LNDPKQSQAARRHQRGVSRVPALADFVKHAEQFGGECVYETAEAVGLRAPDLGYLARHLRRIDRTWRLSAKQRDLLILGLMTEGIADKKIRDMAGVSQDTLARFRKQSEAWVVEPPRLVSMGREVRKLTWDREYPHRTIYAYFSEWERRSWPTPTSPSTAGDSPPFEAAV